MPANAGRARARTITSDQVPYGPQQHAKETYADMTNLFSVNEATDLLERATGKTLPLFPPGFDR